MATCIKIPVAIPPDGEPSKSSLKAIVSTFLPEWSLLKAEYISLKSDTGHSDSHYFVEVPTSNESGISKVFIKLHRDENPSITALKSLVPSKDMEAYLGREFGETGYGPRMIGFFQTENGVRGRVDEMLDSRTLEPEDVEDEDIRADIAKAYAALHGLGVTGVRQLPVDSYYNSIIEGLGKYHKMEKLKRLGLQGGVNVDQVVDYDFTPRIRRLVASLRSIEAKEAWCMHDVQYGNVLVKTNPKPGESKVALVDFELVFRNFRAVDIAAHWFQKMFKWTNEQSKVVDGCRPYSEEEKRHFCEAYARKWNEMTGEQDTGEQVYAEASLGYGLALLFDIHFMLMAMDEDDNDDPLDAEGLNKLFEEFTKHYAMLGQADFAQI